jgi:CRISPR system Cascade subunit CasD
MARFLLFTLYAPLAAFGDIAVGESRGGFDRPGRSAILGLAAAALGIDRRDEKAHAELDGAYALALRVEATGTLIEDYHTIQAPPARRGKRWPTRRAALEEEHLETLLSTRDYRADALSTVALIGRRAPTPAPERLAEAFTRPAFTLYLGRKACPLGLPLRPLLTETANLASAFAAFDAVAPAPEKEVRSRLRLDPADRRFFADAELRDGPESGLLAGYAVRAIESRRDGVASRQRWQFRLRDELELAPAGGKAPS